MNIITCETFGEAAEMAVRCSKIMKLADEGDLDAILRMKTICDCEPVKPASPNNPPRLSSQKSFTSGKPGVGDGRGGFLSQKVSIAGDMKTKKGETASTKLQPLGKPATSSFPALSTAKPTYVPPKKPFVASPSPQKSSTLQKKPPTPPQNASKLPTSPQSHSVDKNEAKPSLKNPSSASPSIRPMGTFVPPKKIPATTSTSKKLSTPPQKAYTPYQKASSPPEKSLPPPQKNPLLDSKPSSASSSASGLKPVPKSLPTTTQSSPDKKPQTSPATSNPQTISPNKKSFSTVPSSPINDKSQQDSEKPDNKDPFANGDTVIIKT